MGREAHRQDNGVLGLELKPNLSERWLKNERSPITKQIKL